MKLHEYQAKKIFADYGIPIPKGKVVRTQSEAATAAFEIGGSVVIKAQVHAGGRGKAGGVKILNTIEELSVAAQELLGKNLITHQTGPKGREVKRLYVEVSSNILKEFYLSCLVDRASS